MAIRYDEQYVKRPNTEIESAVDNLLGKENIKTLPGYVWYMEI